MSEKPDLTPETEDTEILPVEGKTIHVNGLWSFLVWLFGPVRDVIVNGGAGLIITTAALVFIGYELDKLGAPLIEKYGEYIDGQTAFTTTVKTGMESQAKAIASAAASTEAVKVLVAQNGVRIDTTSQAAIAAAAAAKIAASNADESARQAALATQDVARKLLEAGELMDGVSKRRDAENTARQKAIEAQTGVLGELLGVQRKVLEVLSKNEPTPQQP